MRISLIVLQGLARIKRIRQMARVARDTEGRMDITGRRILIVDDHSLMRRMVAAELRKLGNPEIDEAADGESALQKINEASAGGKPYQMVFLDWTMPKLDGFSVLTACRAHAALKDMPIIMLTSESEEANLVKALEAGATAYIAKPFKPEDICKKVLDVMEWNARRAG
ncbi:MAG: response regulator [Alphaproteobacteria bacterium]|nr:response regulator [Alphaproteobacteria bacterium]